MNNLRIAEIGILVDRCGISQASGFLHFFEGWVIFLACLIMLYSEALLLQRLRPRRSSVYEALDLDWSSFARRTRQLGMSAVSRQLVLSSFLVVLATVFWLVSPAR
jgi:hypothetical protein